MHSCTSVSMVRARRWRWLHGGDKTWFNTVLPFSVSWFRCVLPNNDQFYKNERQIAMRLTTDWQQWCARIPAWLCRHACCTITLRYTLSTTYINSILRQTANTYFLNIVDNSRSTENKTILWNSTKCDSSRIHQNNLSAGSGSSFPVFAFSPGYLTLLESQLAPDLSHREACRRFGRMHTHTRAPTGPTFSLTFLLFSRGHPPQLNSVVTGVPGLSNGTLIPMFSVFCKGMLNQSNKFGCPVSGFWRLGFCSEKRIDHGHLIHLTMISIPWQCDEPTRLSLAIGISLNLAE